MGGIAVNWRVSTPKFPLLLWDQSPGLIQCYLGPDLGPNGITFRSTALAGCASVTDNIRTKHATVICIIIGGIAFNNAA